MLALDVSVISPVSACFIKGARNSFDPEPLQAAKSREKEKVETDQLWVSAEAVDPCYEKIPVVFEATGAWGKSAQDWFRMVMVSFKVKFPEGIHRSSPLGMEHHWGATSFQAYYPITIKKSRCPWPSSGAQLSGIAGLTPSVEP